MIQFRGAIELRECDPNLWEWTLPRNSPLSHRGIPGRRRASALGVAVLYAAVTALLAPLHARLDAELAVASRHIETPENPDCAFHDGHLLCQLTRLPSLTGLSHTFVPDLALPPVRAYPPRPHDPDPEEPGVLEGAAAPRGPPSAWQPVSADASPPSWNRR